MLTRSKGRIVDPLILEFETRHRRVNREEGMGANNPNMEALMKRMEEMQARLDEHERRATEEPPPPINNTFRPPTERYQGGEWGPINANNFELKPGLIHMVQAEQFGGGVTEDPNAHLCAFLDICDTIKQNGVPNDTIRMRLFGFSLRDRAKDWYKGLNKAELHTWDDLCKAFLAKYFPPSKTHKLISEISHFSQHGDETLFEAWERYRELLRKCPQHGFNEDQQVTHFYSGLTSHTKSIVDATAGGCLLNRHAKEAIRILEEMAANSYQWPMERTPSRKVASISEDFDELTSKYTILKRDYEKEKKALMEVQALQKFENGEILSEEEVLYVNQRYGGNFN